MRSYVVEGREVYEDFTEEEWLELRRHDVTSTDVSCLFGASKFKSLYQLWMDKAGKVEHRVQDNERMVWGRRLEGVIAEGLASDAGMVATPYKKYIRLPHYRLGSSFDYETDDGALLEIKTVDPLQFKNDWFELPGGGYIAPEYIEYQIQQQLLLTQRTHLWLGVLIGGNKAIPLQKREPDLRVHDEIKQRAADFWRSIEAGDAPAMDFEDHRDVSTVIKAYSHAEPKKTMQAPDELEPLAHRYMRLSKLKDTCDKQRNALKARMLMLVGDCERVYGNGYTISARVQGPSEYLVKRDGFRNFRLTRSKKGRASE